MRAVRAGIAALAYTGMTTDTYTRYNKPQIRGDVMVEETRTHYVQSMNDLDSDCTNSEEECSRISLRT
jgi:hypothetical protein